MRTGELFFDRGHSLAVNRQLRAASAASVLQASAFLSDVTVFRLNATAAV
jgi:hypothetical protein